MTTNETAKTKRAASRSRPFSETDTSAVRRAADLLREIILSKPVGTHLGSQEDLLKLLGIGKVTLQQTARVLEHEALLEVRRGVHGGYFRSRPDIGLVTRSVEIYLHAKDVKPSDHQAITRAISAELMRQAVHSRNDAAWKKLEALERQVSDARSLDESLLNFEAISQFFDILYELADNPLGEMIMRVNARLFSSQSLALTLKSDDAKWAYHRIRLRMIRALLDRDADYADLLAKRFSAFMDEAADANT
jgi:DNA-binding FadR family transcriptional regulator